MMKRTIFAVLGLAFAMALVSPQTAHAGVIVGVGVGPVVVARPYGYVAPVPAPYYGYAPVYVHPHFVRPYAYYGPVYHGGYWGRPAVRAYRGYGWRGYRR